jgi:hypothetical protein
MEMVATAQPLAEEEEAVVELEQVRVEMALVEKFE